MRMQDIDFQRGRGQMIFMFIIVLVIFAIGPGTLFYFFISDLTDGDASTPMDSTTGIFALLFVLIAFAVLMFYAVFNPWRFSYSDEGVQVITWRGPQFFRWSDVKKAGVYATKGGYSMSLNFGGLRRVYIPLNSYRKSRSLLMEISRRLPVKVQGERAILALVRDV